MRWLQTILPYLLAILILCTGFAASILLEHIPSREENTLTTTEMDMRGYPLYIAESETLTLYPWNHYDSKKNHALHLSRQNAQEVNLGVWQAILQLNPEAAPAEGVLNVSEHLELDETEQYLFLKDYSYEADSKQYVLSLAYDTQEIGLIYYSCIPVQETHLSATEKKQAMEHLQMILQDADKTTWELLYNDTEDKIEREDAKKNPFWQFLMRYGNVCANNYDMDHSYYIEQSDPWMLFDSPLQMQVVSYNDMMLLIGTNFSNTQIILFYEPRTGIFCGLSTGE